MNDLNKSTPSTKLYLEIVEKLREMIDTDGLVSGDKIPSERELSERLNVGRSSIREALRALELLGLIETRRGEGTFIRDYQDHNLIKLLGTFFLQDPKVKQDLAETKEYLETNCIRIVISSSPEQDLEQFLNWATGQEFSDDEFFTKLVGLNSNFLMERIWTIVNSYARAANQEFLALDYSSYIRLIHLMIERNINQAISHYLKNIRKK
ncbi:FadR/GntR family transcriptional regulator [Peribacillus huizhouensis]|uniref:DNA-binding FadR family transcriptional regulator n=1 Tax=Peribacillus huizhouensis TaxID=1501239 RepID=A0ABR6CMR8_9BACI|nr:GntR family transcriptional regulator [Peribacillus huizhouensis]MBA9025875.1 DNA-binding FadR family transcriptional regulator [Peribacillus huizhouensis]